MQISTERRKPWFRQANVFYALEDTSHLSLVSMQHSAQGMYQGLRLEVDTGYFASGESNRVHVMQVYVKKEHCGKAAIGLNAISAGRWSVTELQNLESREAW
jgi:hypothetical protein